MDPDINNVEVPDWIAIASSVFFFIMLCLPYWVKGTVKYESAIPGLENGLAADSWSGTIGAQWGWVAIIGVIAVWATFVIVILGVDLPFPKWLGYLAGGGFAAFITILMIAIRPGGPGGFSYLSEYGGVSFSKLPWVSSWLAILACGGMIAAAFMKRQTEVYY